MKDHLFKKKINPGGTVGGVGAGPRFLSVDSLPGTHIVRIILLIERVPHSLSSGIETAFHVLPPKEYMVRKPCKLVLVGGAKPRFPHPSAHWQYMKSSFYSVRKWMRNSFYE
ncbi:hypothetical protein Y032_0149g2724 [Ancylostoma ceylanicum]|uniref:Uncharacterized protein n=1 Tax=Ancylostoma ceylanicum TaxID=53326 RepID=A0A016T212_9BILA|nr:hypothetical protein Y032_0149g2724 [Ancylostoma ceylanicum]